MAKGNGRGKNKGKGKPTTNKKNAKNGVNVTEKKMIHLQVKIELCSELCMASGNSFAGVVDQEVVYDPIGLPYIPARRLKGCLRETAKLVCDRETEEKLFGSRGDGISGAFRITNAVLPEAEELQQAVKQVCEKDSVVKKYMTAPEILRVYTSLMAQTKIEEKTGIAEENSLRVTRVVNSCNPLKKQDALTFTADIVLEDASLVKDLERCIKATRNIGLNRNRGYGSVKCTVSTVKDKDEVSPFNIEKTTLNDGSVCITYMLENTSPLVLSDGDKENTVSYISGKAILGALAGEYLKNSKNTADSDEFYNLFLNGTVKYTNANLAKDNVRCYPAPLYMNYLKKTKKYINIFGEKTELSDEYNTENGNTPKKLKGKYISSLEKNGKTFYEVIEPKRELIYHHSCNHGEENPQSMLYSMEVLSSGQRFIGKIYAPKDTNKARCADTLISLLKTAKFSFGKSRSAQYGSCKCVSLSKGEEQKKKQFKAGETIVVTLYSDALFAKNNGSYTVKFDEVKALLAQDLGISYDGDKADQQSMMGTTEVTGYNTTWKKIRPSYPAVSAGSAFVYILKEDLVVEDSKVFVGKRNLEGFGEVAVEAFDKMSYQVAMVEKEEHQETKCSKDIFTEKENVSNILKTILKPKLVDELLLEKFEKRKINISASTLGRVTLMFKDSYNECSTPDEIAENWCKRVDTIKDKKTKQVIIGQIAEFIKRQEDGSSSIDVDKMVESFKRSTEATYLLSLINPVKRSLLKEVWVEYMFQYLQLLKYQKKGD